MRDASTRLLRAKSGGIAAILAAALTLSGCGGTWMAPLGGIAGNTDQASEDQRRQELEARLADLERQAAELKGGERAAPGPAQPPVQGRFSVTGSGGSLRGFVAADEPQAVLIARNVLMAGGTAADAAAALYFGLAVAYPGAAGLGGGGICLARSQSGDVESIEFLAKTPATGGPVAIPGNLAGIAQLQTRHGVLRWSDIVTPAQRLASAGVVSRAYAEEIATLGSAKSVDAEFNTLVRHNGAELKVQGDALDQDDLGVSLAQIRTSGANALYRGPLGRAFLDAAHAKGSAVTADELAGYQPNISAAETFDLSGTHLRIPSLATGAGQLAAETLSAARGATDRGGVDAAVAKSLASLGAPPNANLNYGSTSFLVVDGGGREVACALTMNGPFGAQALVPNTGIVMAKNPANTPEGYGNAFLAPMFVEAPGVRMAYLVASAAGGPSALGNIVTAVIMTRNDRALGAHDVLPVAGAATNFYVCRTRKNDARDECTIANGPASSGLAAVITER